MSDDEENAVYDNYNPLVDRLQRQLNINNMTDNESELDFNSDDEIPDSVGLSFASGGNNTHPFINTGIRPNRFARPVNSPAINSEESHSSRNRSFHGPNWATNQGPDAIRPGTNTQITATASRFPGPRGFRGPRPLPPVNSQPVTDANRSTPNVQLMRPQGRGSILPNTTTVGFNPVRPPFGFNPVRPQVGFNPVRSPVGFNPVRSPVGPVATKLAEDISQSSSPIPVNRLPYTRGPRPIGPNLFQPGGNFQRPPLSSTPGTRSTFAPGMDFNSLPFIARGQKPQVSLRQERIPAEPSKAKLPSTVTHHPSPVANDEPNEGELEIYDPPEGDYETGDEDDDEPKMQTPNGPPELPPPHLPPPVRAPVAPVWSSHPRFQNKPVLPRYPSPMGTGSYRTSNSTAPVHHPNDNIRAPKAQSPVTDDEVGPQVPPSLPSKVSLPSRMAPFSTTPKPFWSLPGSPKETDSSRNAPTATGPPLPTRPPPSRFTTPIVIRPPASQISVQRTMSNEGVPSLKPLTKEERGIETTADSEGYEQLLPDHGSGPSVSYPTWPRDPAAVRGARPNFLPVVPNQRMRMPHSANLTKPLMHLENGDSFESTPLYESLLQEEYFHLITSQEVPGLLTQDGMFLFQPSSSRTDSNPLTLWLRYYGRNYKFSINKRRDGGYAIGKEKENEDKFSSIQEMADYYRYNPLKFEGRQMIFRDPAPKH